MEDFSFWAHKLYEKGLSPGTSGNISKRLTDGILISASGSALGDVGYDDIIKVGLMGDVISGNRHPSSEVHLHLKIYEKRPDIKAIIHSHAPSLTAFAVSGKEINEAIIPELPVYFGKIPVCGYYMPSSMELAENVSKLFEKHNAVLMQNHGIILGASDLKTAFYLLEMLNMYAQIYINSKILGGKKVLSKAQIKDLSKLKR